MASVRGTDPCLAAGSDPDCVTTNRDRDTTYVGTGPCQLPWPLSKKGKSGQTRTEKEIGQNRKKTHLNQRKKSGLFLLFALAFALHLSFMILKALKLKKSQRQRKIRVRIRPSLNGYGLGTRIRTTLVRILIPGPATDPHLRIRSPVLALGARTTGLILHFLNGLFDMNFYLEKGVPPLAFDGGELRLKKNLD